MNSSALLVCFVVVLAVLCETVCPDADVGNKFDIVRVWEWTLLWF